MSRPSWIFPSRNGGIDFVGDPSSAHFSDAPVSKLVRETIQNSLDAKHSGFSDPVTVQFTETEVRRGLIGGAALERHLNACLQRAESDSRNDISAAYSHALGIVRKRNIPCLKIEDTFTTGLTDKQWNALVLQEGAVSKGNGAPGGSFGIGKNAVMNVSDLQTVFYSTRYVQGRKGRVEKLQGKATLIGHSDPSGSGDDLQHIGFYCQQDGSPVMGRSINQFFRLDESGTGVFIIGFNPHSSNWVDQLVTAVIENFFYAVHHQSLVVKVFPKKGNPVTIDHQTIDYLFGRVDPVNRDARHYYGAIRDLTEDEIEQTGYISKVGRLNAFIDFKDGAPRRVAHINRNGMLITDSREQRVNPLAPRGKSLWPDYVGVVVPDSDSGDLWLRRMENPSHDALASGHLLNEKDRKEADRALKEARRALGAIFDRKTAIDRYAEESNLDELAASFPDNEGMTTDKKLETKVVSFRSSQPELSEIEVDDEVSREGGGPGDAFPDSENDGGGQSAGNGASSRGENGNVRVKGRARRPVLSKVRYIPLTGNEAVIAFDVTGESEGRVNLSLMPAGGDKDPRSAQPMTIVEATKLGDSPIPLAIENGTAVLPACTKERVMVKVLVDGALEQNAFRLR